MKNILLQTTIPYAKDDWSIERFSILADYLLSLSDDRGNKLYRVTARNRENNSTGDDKILSKLGSLDFDQLWLFGVDVGDGLTPADCEGITAFRKRGGGLLTSRDHQDLGISFCTLGGVGTANHFHSKNPEADPSRLTPDDSETPEISWPNYHSGSNGDFQKVEAVDPLHPVMSNPGNASGKIEHLPSHPHEGAVSVPADSNENPRVIATGSSTVTGRKFNLAIAFEGKTESGLKAHAIADSSFHHFLDYNFDPAKGCPSYVTEAPGYGLLNSPQALADSKTYIRNIAGWLSSN
jgi:hypothetical protein